MKEHQIKRQEHQIKRQEHQIKRPEINEHVKSTKQNKEHVKSTDKELIKSTDNKAKIISNQQTKNKSTDKEHTSPEYNKSTDKEHTRQEHMTHQRHINEPRRSLRLKPPFASRLRLVEGLRKVSSVKRRPNVVSKETY